MSFNGAPVMAATVVAVDVGKNKAALAMTSADRHRLFGPVDFADDRASDGRGAGAGVCGAAGGTDQGGGGGSRSLSPTAAWGRGCGRRAGRFWS